MNYFAHGYRYLDQPYFLAGTAVPDWLRVSDRGVRVRAAAARAWCHSSRAEAHAAHTTVPSPVRDCPDVLVRHTAALASALDSSKQTPAITGESPAAASCVRGVSTGTPPEPLQPVEAGRHGGLGDDPGHGGHGEVDQAEWVSQIAAGIVQHHEDDAWFHATPAFAEVSSRLSALVREVLPDQGLRTWFLGHLLVELLLDAELISARPQALEDYYAALAAVDPQVVERAVNLMVPRPAERLARFVRLFLTERFLCDYADDGKLAWRLEQVLRRAGLPPAGQALVGVLPTARRLVSQRAADLLTPHLSDPIPPPPASFLETGI